MRKIKMEIARSSVITPEVTSLPVTSLPV